MGGYYWSTIDLEHDEFIEIDYVKIFANTSDFENWSREINQSFKQMSALINGAEEMGINTTHVRTTYAKAQDLWQNNSFRPLAVKTYLNTINHILTPAMDNHDEILDQFNQAETLIQKAQNEGTTTKSLRAKYENAREAWQKPDYNMTKMYLEEILQGLQE
jgi:hypothetical protein